MKYDLTGKVFNWLTVLKENGKDEKNNTEWLCKCKCGKYKIATTYELNSGKTKSCGCYNSARYDGLTGKYGKLTIIECVGKDEKNYKLYRCKCDCGNEVIVKGTYLSTGHTKSCGCNRKNQFTTHGFSSKDERLYNIYNSIFHRCYHKNCNGYKYYGAKGIKICDEWQKDIKLFFDFAYSHGYDKTKTIDRINSCGDYCPENCRFVSKKLNVLRSLFKRWKGYDPTDEEIFIVYGYKEP